MTNGYRESRWAAADGKPRLPVFVLILGTAMAGEERYPSRPIEMIVPFPPGGGGDIVARILLGGVEPALGQKIIIINRAGAVGTIGQQQVARAKPDGYTIGLMATGTDVVTPHLMALNYKLSDFAPVTQVTDSPIVFCVRADSPMRDAQDLVAYARKNPDELTYAANGVGGSSHVMGERLFQPMNIKLRLISYKGAGELMPALLGDQVDLYAGSLPSVLPFVQSGRARCLLSTTKERVSVLPNVMAARDLGFPEHGSSSWHGIVAPAQTPRDRMLVLEKAFRDAARRSAIEKKLEEQGLQVVASSGEEFGQFLEAEYKAYGVVIKKLGLDVR